MAVGTGIFRTPTGRTYEVAPQIQQQFDRTANVIYGAMQRESDRQKEQEALFGQLYSNLGEIEGRLQEEYNGLSQQAVDSLRQEMAAHYAKGGRATDPEFMSRVSTKVGRIKGAMANANKIREQINGQIKSLADNPYMDYESKNRAVTEMLQMAANPDVLISKNPIDFSGIINKYVNPDLVFKDAYLNLPSLGEAESIFTNERGDEMSRTLVLNDLVDSANPFDDQGRPNIQLDPARALEILKNNPMLAAQTERIRRERYSNEPTDIGTARALRDGFMTVAPLAQKTRVRRTADQIAKEQAAINRQNTLTDLAIQRESRLARKEGQAEADYAEMNDRWQRFNEAYNQGELGFLGEYESLNPGKKGFAWMREKDQPKYQIASSYEDWAGSTKSQRIALLNELGIETPTGAFGQTKSDSEEAFNAVRQVIDSRPDNIIGLKFLEKEGTKDGQTNWSEQTIPIEGEDDMIRVFQTLENLRKKGKVPETVVPKTQPQQSQEVIDLTQKSYWNTQ